MGLLGAHAPSKPQIWSMFGKCEGNHSPELYARLDRAFQTSGNIGKPIIGPTGKHIALGIKYLT